MLVPSTVNCQVRHLAWSRQATSRSDLSDCLVCLRLPALLLNQAEHERRNAYELGPVTDPGLLESLLELQPGEPVTNLVFWAETSSLPGGIVGRGDDGYTVTRLLEMPLAVRDVILHPRKGRELLAVQDASLFVGFTARWVSVGHEDIRRTLS